MSNSRLMFRRACVVFALVPIFSCMGCDGPSTRSDPLSSEPLTVRITGHDFHWHIRYPGPDGELDTPDDILTHRHLHLPASATVQLNLQSKDYVYSVRLPHLDLWEVAVPDHPFTLEFVTGPAGNHELLGSQMCGYTHPQLIGDVVVHSQRDFGEWLQSTSGL